MPNRNGEVTIYLEGYIPFTIYMEACKFRMWGVFSHWDIGPTVEGIFLAKNND